VHRIDKSEWLSYALRVGSLQEDDTHDLNVVSSVRKTREVCCEIIQSWVTTCLNNIVLVNVVGCVKSKTLERLSVHIAFRVVLHEWFVVSYMDNVLELSCLVNRIKAIVNAFYCTKINFDLADWLIETVVYFKRYSGCYLAFLWSRIHVMRNYLIILENITKLEIN